MKKTISLALVGLLVLSSVAIVASYAAKAPPTPPLSSTVCASIGGTWASRPSTCTVSGTGDATTSFVIPAKFFLVVTGTLKVESGVTITNSGTITIANSAYRGIINNGTLANAASGVIIIANKGDPVSGTGTVGIYNRRILGDNGYSFATITNAGSITIKNSGNLSYGIYNIGSLTNSGVLTINSLSGAHRYVNVTHVDATGIYNAGIFIQTDTGTYYNYDGYVNGSSASPDKYYIVWGNYNNHGTMINYGTTITNGTFFTNGYTMINFGTIYLNSTGLLYDTGLSSGSSMINYGTIYNYGTIDRGEEYGVCYNLVNGTGC